MELKLDIHALEALFPPNSEARLKLQQSVAEEFCRRHIRALSSAMKLAVGDAHIQTNNLVQDELVNQGFLVKSKNGVSSKPTYGLSADFKAQLGDGVLKALKGAIEDAGKSAIVSVAEDTAQRMVPNIESLLNRLLNEKIGELVSGAFDANLRAMLEQQLSGLLARKS